MQIRTYKQGDESGVIQLWEDCGLTRSWNNPRLDIERKMKVQPELFLVGVLDGEIVASAMAGYDGHRGWVYYLAVSPKYRKRSYGKQIMEKVEYELKKLGCPKLNLQIRSDNSEAIEFYRSLGYVQDNVTGFGKRLIPDN